ncbi:hypothetical protein BVRB_013410 [Beta vulgaris subsp. vulgaris]|uniref:Uncharacterized protein n=1 Tax=Beta vulgaris subsp. vulgaris TaxID=3555 RepID=A0A0J8B1Y3_BETVV|nr:hypothetical protein BVRB_013410 [Beta vulgaris subsp. vulgaris]
MGRNKGAFASFTKNSSRSLFLWMVLLMLSTNNLVLPVVSTTSTNFGSQKNYYSHDPHVPNPSSGAHSSPSHTPTHHGSSGSQSNCGSPPTPSGGSGGYYPSPDPTHTPPTPSGGSGHYYPSPTPTPPSRGGGGGHHGSPKHTPKNPPIGGGGGSSGGCPCLSPPPSSGGGGGYYPPTPLTPTPIVTPPSVPLVPSPPFIPLVPSPPLVPRTPTPFDPTTPPFPCTYWGSHPGLIFGVLGWWATVGGIFGVTTLPGLNSATSLEEMLNNPRNDGYGSLYREGTASFLNSMATKEFSLSTKQVKDAFLASLTSDRIAAAQAKLFKLANEKKLKPATTYSKP